MHIVEAVLFIVIKMKECVARQHQPWDMHYSLHVEEATLLQLLALWFLWLLSQVLVLRGQRRAMIVAQIHHGKHKMIEWKQNQYRIEVLRTCLEHLLLLFDGLQLHFLLLLRWASTLLKLRKVEIGLQILKCLFDRFLGGVLIIIKEKADGH